MIACVYEDRPNALIGAKLLVLSLHRHCPDLEVHLCCPGAPDGFLDWLKQFQFVHVFQKPAGLFQGWDVKPKLLLNRLTAGHSQVLWLDSDLIVTMDIRNMLDGASDATIVMAEEHKWVAGNGVATRTERLGLTVARTFPRTLCSCFLRVTTEHLNLLNRWQELLERPDYRRAQAQSFEDRDWVFGSDQDMLSGLLGSHEFGTVPLRILRSGRDIAHCFCREGYSVADRLRNQDRLPPLVHAQGPKPWELPDVLFAELSPYCAAAIPFRGEVREPTQWMRPQMLSARLLDLLAFRNPNLRDLPLVLWFELKSLASNTIRNILREST